MIKEKGQLCLDVWYFKSGLSEREKAREREGVERREKRKRSSWREEKKEIENIRKRSKFLNGLERLRNDGMMIF